jgi:hypothetical protein
MNSKTQVTFGIRHMMKKPPPPTKLKRGAIPVVNTGVHKG